MEKKKKSRKTKTKGDGHGKSKRIKLHGDTDESIVDKMDIEEKDKVDESANMDEEESEKEIVDDEGKDNIIPFLDTFYVLSSAVSSASENSNDNDDETSMNDRIKAGYDLIKHCFDVNGKSGVVRCNNIKDTSYALKRLLNGLCSSRSMYESSVRQGYSSTLTLLLKLSFHSNGNGSDTVIMSDIQKEYESAYGSGSNQEAKEEVEEHPLEFVRNTLLQITDPKNSDNGSKGRGRMKQSQINDYYYGRLFGILSVIQSGILQQYEKDGDKDDNSRKNVINGYVSDLIDIHNKYNKTKDDDNQATTNDNNSDKIKKSVQGGTGSNTRSSCMKEVAIHGIILLIETLFGNDDIDTVSQVVKDAILPKLLTSNDKKQQQQQSKKNKKKKGDNNVEKEQNGTTISIENLNAEQIAVIIYLQSKIDDLDDEERLSSSLLPYASALVAPENISKICNALTNTSSQYVVNDPQLRTHIVWDIIFSSLTKPKKTVQTKTIEDIGNDDDGVIIPQERVISSASAKDTVKALFQSVVVESLLASSSASQQQKQQRLLLALTIVKILSGGIYNDNNRSSIKNGSLVTINIEDTGFLQNTVLSPTVLRCLFIDDIGATLKPLSLHVLESIVDSTASIEGTIDLERRFAIAKSFLNCDSRFDSKTKTNTISKLLLLGIDDKDDDYYVRNDMLLRDTSRNLPLFDMWTDHVKSLIEKIVSLSSSSSGDNDDKKHDRKSSSHNETLGYIDLLFITAKNILRIKVHHDNDNSLPAVKCQELDEFITGNTERILGFLMSCSFFDCTSMEAINTKNKEEKGDTDSAVLEGLHIKDILLRGRNKNKKSSKNKRGKKNEKEASNDNAVIIPFNVREVLSSRFFSLLADYISLETNKVSTAGGSARSSKGNRDSKTVRILAGLCKSWSNLEASGANRFNEDSNIGDSNGVDDDEENGFEDSKEKKIQFEEAKKSVMKFQSMAISAAEEYDDNITKAEDKCLTASTVLMSVLYLHFLGCGKPESLSMEEGDAPDLDDDDDDSDDEEIAEYISDLTDATMALVCQAPEESDEEESGKKDDDSNEEQGNPLLDLAVLCVNIFSSSFVHGNNQRRGASSKLIREAVKSTWLGGISAAALKSSLEDHEVLLDKDVMSVLLVAIGAPVEDSQEEADSSDGEDDTDDDDSATKKEDEGVFTAEAANALDMDDQEDVEMKDRDREEDDDETENDADEEDVELEPGSLENMLLQDVDDEDDDDNAGILEHHAGADKALAKLIKIKQEARKAGRQAKERLELTNNLRCTTLMEALATSSAASSGNGCALLKRDVVLSCLLPILQARKSLQKSITASSGLVGKRTLGTLNEKKLLLDRLTALLKSKICKIKIQSLPLSHEYDSDSFASYATSLSCQILEEAKKSDDKDHMSCCSACLILALKSFENFDDKVKAASNAFCEAITEWSTKKTSRFHPTFFEDLIQQDPILSQVCLSKPLAKSTIDARSPFLKSEAFRLVGLIYSGSTTMHSPSSSVSIATEQLNSALSSVQDASNDVVQGAINALQDGNDMCKTKRVRDVLKSIEKMVFFFSKNKNNKNAKVWKQLSTIPLTDLEDKTESHGIKNTCIKLSKDIQENLNSLPKSPRTPKAEKGEKMKPSSSSKKHKKKHKTPSKDNSASKKKKQEKQ